MDGRTEESTKQKDNGEVEQVPVPSSSSSAADDLAVGPNDQQQDLDRALELFACSYNLTAQNVKNIIFHIVKNPQTFATLVRKDPDAMAGLRMTRARLRQLERIARRRIPTARLRPIVAPKTFLDINYGEEEGTATNPEQEDTDYSPANDPTATERRKRRRTEADAETPGADNGAAESSACSSDTDFFCSDMDEEQPEENCAVGSNDGQTDEMQQKQRIGGQEGEADEAQNIEFLTKVDNPIYPIFIKSLATDTEIDPEVRQQLYDDEDNDPEYVFPDFDDLGDEQEDEYEFRRDRATEIPRWEVRALEQDFVDDVDDPSSLDVPVEPICGDGTTNGTLCDRESTVKIFLSSNLAKSPLEERLCSPPLTDQQRHSNSNANNGAALSPVCDTSTTAPQSKQDDMPQAQYESVAAPHDPNSSSSCSLLDPSPTIAPVERDALKVQLEKHVQLLCQAIVGTSQYPDLVEPHNTAMLMLRELDALSREHGAQSVFSTPTLEAAIYSAHDIKACREVDLALASAVAAEENSDEHFSKNVVELFQLNEEQRPSNETMWVLSRSGAIRYPDLLCPYRFSAGDNNNLQPAKMVPPQRFLQSEQLLLAIGLFQLHGVPSRIGKMRSRYQLVQQYFLPAKRIDQIRNHIRNVHSAPSPTIYHQLIMEAEKGHFPVTYRPDLGQKAQQRLPIEWPVKLQPYWLKWLSNLLGKCQTQVVMVDDVGTVAADQQKQQRCVSDCETLIGTGPSPPSPPASDFGPLNQSASSDLSNSPAKTVEKISKIEWTTNRQQQKSNSKTGTKPRILTTAARKRSLSSRTQTTESDPSPTLAQTLTANRQQQLKETTAPFSNTVGKQLEKVGEQQQQQRQSFVDEGDHVGMETRWRKRIRTASSSTTEDGTSHSAVSTASDAGGKGGTTTTKTVTAMANRSWSSAANDASIAEAAKTATAKKITENDDNDSAENVMPAAASSHLQQQKKSRRHERAERGMAALCDAHALGQTDRALASAIYEDFGKRMFMHQDKLRAVQRVLAATAASPPHSPSASSTAQCFASLWQLMGLTHPQLFHLFAAIAPEAQLPHALRADPHRQACKRALRMLRTVHTYLAASRTPAQMKHMLKFLKEASMEITSEKQFFEALQRQFAFREEPLWRLLRREWMGAKFVENVEEWEYEFVDMDKHFQQQHTSEPGAVANDHADNDSHRQLRFEHVRLPYRRDPSERSRLRVRHGRPTAELNGRLCNVAIAYAPSTDLCYSASQSFGPPSGCSTTTPAAASDNVQLRRQQQHGQSYHCCWTRKMDMELMLAYKSAGGDPNKCLDIFLQQRPTQCKIGESVTADDVANRLSQLLRMANTLRQRRETTERARK